MDLRGIDATTDVVRHPLSRYNIALGPLGAFRTEAETGICSFSGRATLWEVEAIAPGADLGTSLV